MGSKTLRVLTFVFSAFLVLAFTAGVTQAANKYLFTDASGTTADQVKAGSSSRDRMADPTLTPDPSMTPEPSTTPEPTQAGQENVEFSGVITAIELEWWTIGEFVVQVTADTELEGSPVVGDTVSVEAFLQPDGSYIAHEISLEDGAMGDDDAHEGEHMTGTPKDDDDHEEQATGTPEMHDDDENEDGEHDEHGSGSSEEEHEHDHGGGGGDHDGGGDD